MATVGKRYRKSYQSAQAEQGQQFWAHLILISIVAYVLFSQRVIVGVSTGGRGNLQALDLWIPALAVLLLLGLARVRGARLIQADSGSIFWWPYIVLTIALPCLAVLVQNYPVRIIYGSIQGFVALGFLVLGAWIAFADEGILRLGRVYAWVAVVGEWLFALIDYLHKTGLYRTRLGEFLLQWNVASEGTLGEYTFLTWRCVGTYVNPNELGFWSVMAFWISALLLRGMLRFTGIIAALMTLVLSQSRGSLFALFGTLALWLGYLALSRDRSLRRVCDTTYVSVICCFLAVAWTGGVLSQFHHLNVASEFSFVERFQRGLDVVSEGASADPNVEGRIAAWRKALVFYYAHPLGTWASPRLIFHSYIDNDYFRALVQGSPVYVFAMLLALYGGLRRIALGGIAPRITALFSAAIAINAISAYPFLYPAIGVYWLSLGYDLVANRSASASFSRHLIACGEFPAEPNPVGLRGASEHW